jgi:hypothetical protein
MKARPRIFRVVVVKATNTYGGLIAIDIREKLVTFGANDISIFKVPRLHV